MQWKDKHAMHCDEADALDSALRYNDTLALHCSPVQFNAVEG